MSRQKTYLRLIKALFILADIAGICLAWMGSYFVRFHTFFSIDKGIPLFVHYIKLMPFLCVIWIAVSLSRNIYKNILFALSVQKQLFELTKITFLSGSFFIIVSYFYSEFKYSRATLLIFFIFQVIFIFALRYLVRKFLNFQRKKAFLRQGLYIGTGKNFDTIQKMAIIENIHISSIILTEKKHMNFPEQVVFLNLPEDWAEFLAQKPFEAAFIDIDSSHSAFLEKHMDQISNQITYVRLIPDLAEFTKFSSSMEMVNGKIVLNIHESPLSGYGWYIKRLLDILGSSFGILIFSPLMIICALLVKLTSKGPIFYRQERMGVDGMVFHMLKFRSMPIDSEIKTGAVWASKEDTRATSFGSLMRKTSLDELPQFFNVLKGDMSLVGPRPERPFFVNQFRKKVPGYMLRHKVKSGITGWAQINGWRGNTSIEQRIQCDLYYIQNWSLWFDIKILILTLFKGFMSPNAY